MALAGVVLIVIIGTAYSQRYLYRIFQSDYDRHALIIDVFKKQSSVRNIIVFGGSQSMFGIDTKQIDEVLKYDGEIFNLSSAGQNLFESSYFYSLIDTTTELVIQCVSPSLFTKNKDHRLFEDKAISMFLSGYRIDEETRKLIKDYNTFFDRSTFINYIDSRTYYKSYVHNLIRPFFDNEQFDKSVRTSLSFPHIYTIDRHPNYPVYACNCEEYFFYEHPSSQLRFLADVKEFFDNKGIKYILMFMPVNPDECHDCYEDFKTYKRMIEDETGIETIDLSGLIKDANLFYDAYHPNKAGAKIISSEIALQLLPIVSQIAQ